MTDPIEKRSPEFVPQRMGDKDIHALMESERDPAHKIIFGILDKMHRGLVAAHLENAMLTIKVEELLEKMK
jgi:hypothetical protein